MQHVVLVHGSCDQQASLQPVQHDRLVGCRHKEVGATALDLLYLRMACSCHLSLHRELANLLLSVLHCARKPSVVADTDHNKKPYRDITFVCFYFARNASNLGRASMSAMQTLHPYRAHIARLWRGVER